jgi:hypothetical protein
MRGAAQRFRVIRRVARTTPNRTYVV